MKKKLLKVLGLSLLAFSMTACGGSKNKDKGGDNTPAQQLTYTVVFMVDGERYATSKVKSGEKITDEIADPVLENQQFIGWFDGDTLVDLSTYVVTQNVTLEAHFEEISIPEYNISDTKDDSKTYYLVLGWWECTDTKADGSPKLTSYLTPYTVRLFYHNLRAYLTRIGATEENLNAISFRDYSTKTVAEMGTKVNTDADVDILIGVGNNINSTAGVTLHTPADSYKFETQMGSPLTKRTVACPATASDFGKATYEWLRDTQAGKKAFTKLLTQQEIENSVVIDLTVTVHGDEPVATRLQDKITEIQMPTITVPADKVFKGFAIVENGEVVLRVAKDAVLTFMDVKDLIEEGARTLDLYPVLIDVQTAKVYINVDGTNLKEAEAKLLQARFESTLDEGEFVVFEYVNGDDSAFTTALASATDADIVVGSESALSGLQVHADGAVASVGEKHFGAARKVAILNTVNTKYLEFVKRFYNFVKADAIEFEFHYTYWHNNHTWVTEAEVGNINNGIDANLNHLFGFNTPNQYKSAYNIKLTSYEAEKTKVGDLGAETRALRNGKGTDLIIGCGGNAGTTGGMTFVEDVKDIPTTIVANSRKIGLCNENPLARYIYDIFSDLYDIYS